jgi:hypothetical protein
MDTTATFSVYVVDAGHQLYMETPDYEEAVELCRRLVAEDGYAGAEVWVGLVTCYVASYRDGALCTRVERDADDAVAALTSRAPSGPAADREIPLPPIVDDAGDVPPMILGDDPGRPEQWLG